MYAIHSHLARLGYLDGSAKYRVACGRPARSHWDWQPLAAGLTRMFHCKLSCFIGVKEHAEFTAAHEAAIAKEAERACVLDANVDKLVLANGDS